MKKSKVTYILTCIAVISVVLGITLTIATAEGSGSSQPHITDLVQKPHVTNTSLQNPSVTTSVVTDAAVPAHTNPTPSFSPLTAPSPSSLPIESALIHMPILRLSGVFGLITIGPISPICQTDIPCNGPYVGPILIQSQTDQGQWKDDLTTSTSTDGSYRINLEPGSYQLSRTNQANSRFNQPYQFTVTSQQFTELNLDLDSGIR